VKLEDGFIRERFEADEFERMKMHELEAITPVTLLTANVRR
jgi:hypothetical protein